MDEDLQNIEDLFKAALDDNEDMPSKKVWDGIDNRLDKENIIAIEKKYNTVKRIAFLLLLLVAGFSVYELNNHNGKNNLVSKNNNVANEFTDTDNVTGSKKNLITNKATGKVANDITFSDSENNSSKDSLFFNEPQILTGKSVTKIKIKNAVIDEQVVIESNEDRKSVV